MNNPDVVSNEVVRTIRHKLLDWYRRNARDLPWRRTTNPYCIWLSEIMLQQTRVEQGLPYYERFLIAFPTVRDLAAAPLDSVLKQWEGLGYYTRARNLHKAAKVIVDDLGGTFPRTAAEWQRLPGVGRYTANAIASIAFGEAVPVLDGNVKRVLARLFAIHDSIDDTATTHRLWTLADAVLSRRSPGNFNQAMMELGARVCIPATPLCEKCPVRAACRAYAASTQTALPVRTAKAGVPHYDVVVAAIMKDGTYLLGRRPEQGLLGGLWEFPGGKVRPGEAPEDALVREVREEVGLKIRVGDLVATVNHAYSHFRITLSVYRCRVVSGTVQAKTHTALRWVKPCDFEKLAFPKANHKFLRYL